MALQKKGTAEDSLSPAGGQLLMMPTLAALRVALFAVASGLLFGVDLGSIGGATNAMQEQLGLGTIEVEAIVSGAKGGAIFGSLLGGALMQRYGRRNTVGIALLPFFIGPALIGFASSFVEVLIGRILVGMGIGIASAAAPCFLSEVSPAPVRGAVVSLYELAIAIGFFVASLITYSIEVAGGEEHSVWRFQAGLVPLATALPLLLACSLVPESPRWLLSVAGGDAERLKNALHAMDDLGCMGARERLDKADSAATEGDSAAEAPAVQVQRSWKEGSRDDIVALWDAQHELAGSPLLLTPSAAAQRPADLAAAPAQSSVVWILWETLSDIGAVLLARERVPAGSRRGLLLAMIAAVLTQACASTSVLVYSQHILRQVGVHSLELQDALSISVAAAKVIGVATGLVIVNKVGRRPLMGWGGALSAVMLTVLAAGHAAANLPVLLVGMCGFILVYCATWASGYWVVVTEVTAVAGRYTAACQAASTAVMFTAGWATGLTFASVTEAGGPWAIMVYAGVAVLMALYGWLLLPETRGVSLEECKKCVSEGSVNLKASK